MKALVTGAAGFIGSHLCERLVSEGFEVIGIDSFTDYYDPERKRKNIESLLSGGSFTLVEEDINDAEIDGLLEGVDVVFHLAAQAGVRSSWGREFSHYTESNILATQKVLEALKGHNGIKLVHSSSSSVYGETVQLPMKEEHPLKPVSPYGATKLAAEHLCELYYFNYGLRYVALRYFTVYGPRQRPDMAFSRFILGALGRGEIEVFGDGEQTRDFTYVSDAVEANILAMRYEGEKRVFNIGGGSRVSINKVISIIESIVGESVERIYLERARGDVSNTWADTSLAAAELGFRPSVSLEDGLEKEIEWYREYISSSGGGEAVE